MLSAVVSAQTTGRRIDSMLTAYSEQYPQEKIYLQFDRGVYNPGETIWFKAYLLAGFAPGTISRTIYFDWYDGGGKLLKHMAAPVFEASAKGQFDVPAGYEGGVLHVRAYTQWMLNFDTAFLYDEKIPVALPVGFAAPARKPEPARTQLAFFPEGGDLVTGLVSKVAFKANDQWGRPVTVSGVVEGSDGSIVDSLTTEHDGMGSFMIRPLPGVRYIARWTDAAGKKLMTELPAAAPGGFALQVEPRNGECTVIIRRTPAIQEEQRSVYLLAHMNERVVYAAQVSLEDKPEIAVTVPTADLPTGVLQYTLFDREWKPVAERVVFVDNGMHSFTTAVRVVASSREKRGRNELTIEVADSAFANLSVAVTDAGLAAPDDDIVSRLLLSSDLRGAIYHPSYYFSGAAGGVASRQLDLVMLTHGWRRFRWADVVAGKLPALRYPRDTNYLELRGSVVPGRVHEVVAGQPVLLILETKDSSRKRLLVPVSSDGRFVQRDMLFYDTMRVYYDFPGNRKLSGAHSVEIGSNLLGAFGGVAPGGIDAGSGSSGGAFGVGTFSDTAGMGRVHFFAGEEAEREKNRQAMMLTAVTVNGRAKRPVDALDNKYATGPFRREAGYQFDVKDDVLALHSTDIFYYLRQVVPGLEVQYKDGYPIVKWRQTTPMLFVDEVGTKPDLVADIPITDIAYVKVFHPPFLMGGVINPRAGAIAIYTKKGEDVKPLPAKGLNYALLRGYTAERQFYSPDYSADPSGQAGFLPDVRPTLYWDPYVFTDARNHTATITFYNNDVSTKLRIVVEGMNAAGKLTRVEKIIQ